jgi:hypothetical protein
MAGLTQEHVRLINYLEPQGVTVTRTTKGLLFRFPDSSTYTIHWTQSDWRATRNFRANVRAHGLEWPGDYQTKAKRTKPPLKSSIEKVTQALADLNPETVTTVDIARVTGMGSATIAHTMVALGWWHDYKPTNSRRSFVWHPPVDPKAPADTIPDIPEEPESSGALTQTPSETLSEPVAEPVATPIRQHAGREFIDSADSWTVDLDSLNPKITVGKLAALYASTGLQVEIRVWR